MGSASGLGGRRVVVPVLTKMDRTTMIDSSQMRKRMV